MQEKLVAKSLHHQNSKTIHDPDFTALRDVAWIGSKIQCVVDAGANRGQSISSLLAALPNVNIHSFEANPFFFSILEQIRVNAGSQSPIYHSGLGDQKATLPFFIPSLNGKEFLEEATLGSDIFEKD